MHEIPGRFCSDWVLDLDGIDGENPVELEDLDLIVFEPLPSDA